MGAKKRNTAVDRQSRPANVKTRLATNKTATATAPVAMPSNKQQKSPAKAAPKKSLPIKKRISKEKLPIEEPLDIKPRSTSKSKKTECEPSTPVTPPTSTEVTNDKKQSESNTEVEADTKQQAPKDGKTKAISKMLKSLDIQISGFTNILPPEEKIIEVLKSSISENVKTKSRATAVKGNNNSLLNKFSSGKKDHVEKKTPYSSSSSNSPNVSIEDNKDGGNKKEVYVASTSQNATTHEDENSKETHEELEAKFEEPVIETKKKMAAKKAKLEASRTKKKQEELKEEEKLSSPQELPTTANKIEESSEQIKNRSENERKKQVKPKSNQIAADEENSEKIKDIAEFDSLSRQTKQEKFCKKDCAEKNNEEEGQDRKKHIKPAAEKDSSLDQVTNALELGKSKQSKCAKDTEQEKDKERASSGQRKYEESHVKKKQTKTPKGSQQAIERCGSVHKKDEDNHDKKKPVKTALKAKEEDNLESKKDEVENKRKPTKFGKATQQSTEPKQESIANEVEKPSEIPQKKIVSPKKTKQTTKVFKGKCNEDETKVHPLFDPEISSNPSTELNITKSLSKDDEAIEFDLKEVPKKAKSLTILQRLQNKYNMSPVNRKPSVKPSSKKGEIKCSPKKPLETKTSEEQKRNDIYDFKSGSESEDNIKMELPTLKKLREFSDDDDKPLQVAKKKLKENEKLPEQITENPEPKAEEKIDKSNVKTPPKKATAEKKSAAKNVRKPVAKAKRPPTESSSDAKSSTPTDSEDEQKLSTFGQKRHRMASLNAAAKVQCLYENESRTAYELGLSKTVQVVPKIRNINSGSSSEEEKETKLSIKKETVAAKDIKKSEVLKVEPPEEVNPDEKEEEVEVEVETKRELRNVPGRGMGKHWEFESDTDNEAIFIEKLRMKKKKLQKLKALQAKKEKKEKEQEKSEEKPPTKPKKPVKPVKKAIKVKNAASDDGSSESSDHEDKKLKTMKPPPEKPAAEPKKKRKRELKEELIGDYKGILARKRMASLNASAIVAATYEVERHLDRNFASDCSSFESFPEEEKHVSKKSKKQAAVQQPSQPLPQQSTPTVDTKDLKETKDIKTDPSECSDTKDSLKDFKDSVQDAKETSRPTSSSLVIVQDTDVTITGVYVNPKTGSSQEAYCKMQYRVQSSVTEERVLRPDSVEPPKSYTPLGALSSMRPPGAVVGPDDRSTPPTPADSEPPIAESINHPNIYQPNDLSHHDPSEHSHYSYHHHMSPSPMSLHPHPADHASQMHHYGGHQPGADPPPPQALSAHHYHTPQQPPLPSSASMSQGRCESPVRYGGGYQAQHPTLSMTAGGGSSAFCAPPSMQQQQQLQRQQQQQQQHHDMSGK